jgi:galactokinase/mevalonate kinase-like predicted kinase
MKYSIIFTIIVLSFFGCQDVSRPEKPKDLIAKDKMVDILTETYLANAARSVDIQAIISKGIKMDSIIYKNFGIDSLQFAKSNAFYASEVNAYREIVQEVEARLTGMQKKMDSIWEMDQRRKDSINEKLKKGKANAEAVKDSLI